MGNDLIDGFQAGWKVFEPQIAHKLRMKELKKSKGLDAEESKKGRRHDRKMEDLRNQHQTERDKMGRYHDVDMQDARLANAITMQKADLTSEEGIAEAMRKATRIENKKDRAAAMALLKKRFKHEASESDFSREFQKAEKKLDRKLRRDGYKSTESINKLTTDTQKEIAKLREKGMGDRQAAQLKSNLDLQGSFIQRDRSAQDRVDQEFGHQKSLMEQEYKLRGEAPTDHERTDNWYRERSKEYGRLNAVMQNDKVPYAERQEAYFEMMGMHKHDKLKENTAFTMADKGDIEGLMNYGRWLTDRRSGVQGPAPSGGGLSGPSRSSMIKASVPAPKYGSDLGLGMPYAAPRNTGNTGLGGWPPAQTAPEVRPEINNPNISRKATSLKTKVLPTQGHNPNR